MALWPLNMQEVKLHDQVTAQAFKYIYEPPWNNSSLCVIYFLLHLQDPRNIEIHHFSWNKHRELK